VVLSSRAREREREREKERESDTCNYSDEFRYNHERCDALREQRFSVAFMTGRNFPDIRPTTFSESAI